MSAATDTGAPKQRSIGESVRKLLGYPEAGPFALLVGAIIAFTLLNAAFISVLNIGNLLAFTPELGMIAPVSYTHLRAHET